MVKINKKVINIPASCKHTAGQGADRIKLHEISPYGLILPPYHLSTWRLVDRVFRQHNASYQVTLEAGGWEVIKKYGAGSGSFHCYRCQFDGRRAGRQNTPRRIFS